MCHRASSVNFVAIFFQQDLNWFHLILAGSAAVAAVRISIAEADRHVFQIFLNPYNYFLNFAASNRKRKNSTPIK